MKIFFFENLLFPGKKFQLIFKKEMFLLLNNI